MFYALNNFTTLIFFHIGVHWFDNGDLEILTNSPCWSSIHIFIYVLSEWTAQYLHLRGSVPQTHWHLVCLCTNWVATAIRDVSCTEHRGTFTVARHVIDAISYSFGLQWNHRDTLWYCEFATCIALWKYDPESRYAVRSCVRLSEKHSSISQLAFSHKVFLINWRSGWIPEFSI